MRKKVADRAVPVLTEPSKTPVEKASAGRTHINAIKASTDWTNSAEVQTATAAWLIENENLDASNKNIADLESKLATERTNQLSVLRRWDVRKRIVLNAINATCDGSKDKVQGFGLGVISRTSSPEAVVPQHLRAKRSRTVGTATVEWATQRGNHGYLVQHTQDPADPAAFSAPMSSSRGRFELRHQSPGETIHFRVRAIDPALPEGQTDYTPWVGVMVSS